MGMPRKLACEGFCQKPSLLNYKVLRVLDVTPLLWRPMIDRRRRVPPRRPSRVPHELRAAPAAALTVGRLRELAVQAGKIERV